MKRLAVILALILLLPLIAAAVLLVAALEGQPLVARGETISPAAIAQARRMVAANDPRRLRRGEARTAVIPAALLDEGVNYLASRALRGRAALVLAEDAAEIRLSLRLPGPPYLNLRLMVREAEGEPRISEAALGALPLPAGLVEYALASAIGAAGYGNEWRLARQAIRGIAFAPGPGTVTVAYVWEPKILDRARALALGPADVARIKVAQTTFAALLDHRAPGAAVPLGSVLKPLLSLAGDDRRQQRRAALLVLATYLAEKNLALLIPEARHWPRPRRVVLTLRGRYDSAQHFVISAALAAWAGEPVADAIGVYKELDDTRHGSGFSFADLAADRAGTRFGELVARDAERLDVSLAGTFAESELVPHLDGLPEYLRAQEFRRRFGGPNTPAYRQVAGEIEARLAALPLYQ